MHVPSYSVPGRCLYASAIRGGFFALNKKFTDQIPAFTDGFNHLTRFNFFLQPYRLSFEIH